MQFTSNKRVFRRELLYSLLPKADGRICLSSPFPDRTHKIRPALDPSAPLLTTRRCHCCSDTFLTPHTDDNSAIFCHPLCKDTHQTIHEILANKQAFDGVASECTESTFDKEPQTAFLSAPLLSKFPRLARLTDRLSENGKRCSGPLKLISDKTRFSIVLNKLRERRERKKKEMYGVSSGSSNFADAGSQGRKSMKTMAGAGNITSVRAGAMRSARLGLMSGVITAGKVFFKACWQGHGILQAGKLAIHMGFKQGGTHLATNALAIQLGRTSLQHSLRGISNSAARCLGPRSCTAIARAMGQRGLHGVAARPYVARLLRGNLIATIAITIIFSYKHIKEVCLGEISILQGIKNIKLTAIAVIGGMIGGLMGAAFCSSIPFVGDLYDGKVSSFFGFIGGGIVGGIIMGIVGKIVLDRIIEDDCVRLNREFWYITLKLMSDFSLEEGEIIEKLNKLRTPEMFAEMFKHPQRRSYVVSLILPILAENANPYSFLDSSSPGVIQQ